ncbi:MAG: hypothetical protein J0H41_06700 [Rhizobiales bacterium]|nr:hypothetical protein [Hyphomicrobiales bacterium]
MIKIIALIVFCDPIAIDMPRSASQIRDDTLHIAFRRRQFQIRMTRMAKRNLETVFYANPLAASDVWLADPVFGGAARRIFESHGGRREETLRGRPASPSL